MKICCPNCSFTGNAPDDRVIAPGVIATCPKCRTRFQLAAPPPPPPVATVATVVCPKCSARQEGVESCAVCGIVFAKYSRAQEARASAMDPEPFPPPPPPETDSPRGRLVPAAALLAILVAVWFFFTPHLAVRGMRAAAEERDSARLSAYVNFPALKENLKASFNAKIAAEAAKQQDAGPFAQLGAAMAAAFISPIIDMMVTPESLALIMKGDKPEPGKAKGETRNPPAEIESSMAYEGLNRFVVTIMKKNEPKGETMGLVFSREGLFSSWKLTGLRLPL